MNGVPHLDRLRCLRGRQVTVHELAGGLSNRPLRVTTVDAGPLLDIVVRLPTSGPLASDRAAEHAATVAAAQAGVGPSVVEFVPPDGPLAVAWLDAHPLTPQDVRNDVRGVAALCRRLHAGPRFARDVDLGRELRRYAALVAGHGGWLPPGHAALAAPIGRALDALGAVPEPTVPCHNDLPGGNVLDDGSRLWLVDLEFAGNNDPWCELGTLASGAALAPEQVAELVTAYHGGAGRRELARTRLWDAVGSWTFVLWASLQDAVGELEADYRTLAEQLLERAGRGLGPGLDQTLAEVVGAPRDTPCERDRGRSWRSRSP